MSRCQSAADFMKSQYPCDDTTPEQRAELKRMREMWTYNNSAWLEAAARRAISVIIELMGHQDEKGASIAHGTRLKAAESTLSHLEEMKKIEGIEDRIRDLEEMAKQIKKV